MPLELPATTLNQAVAPKHPYTYLIAYHGQNEPGSWCFGRETHETPRRWAVTTQRVAQLEAGVAERNGLKKAVVLSVVLVHVDRRALVRRWFARFSPVRLLRRSQAAA